MRWFPRRSRRWLLIIGLAVLLVLGTGFVILRVELDGPHLGDKLASLLNNGRRGRIEIGSVEWPSSALETVVTGGWVPLVIRDVKVWDDCALSAELNTDFEAVKIDDPNQDCTPDDKPDPDPKSKRKPRKLLLDTPLLTVELDIHAIMFGHHDLVFRKLWIHGGQALIEQTREPQPLHAYNRTIVSIVTAFYPRMKAGFRAGIYAAEAPPTFDLRDIHIEDLNLTVHLAPSSNVDGSVAYSVTAHVEGVSLDADTISELYMDPTDPLVAKFYVRLALKGRRGRIRIQDEGPQAAFRMPNGVDQVWAMGRTVWYDIQLTDIELHRLAQLPTEWAHKNFVANTLELDLSARTLPCKTETGGEPSAKDGAEVHVFGELLDYWDRPYDGAWNLTLDVKNLGPTVRTCIKSTVGGDNLGGTIKLSGPFIAPPRIDFDLHDLDYDLPVSKTEEPVRLTFAGIRGWIDLVNEQGAFDSAKALVRGGKEPGEVMVSATFGVKPLHLKASVDIVKPVDVGRFLPAKVVAAAGRLLGGKLTADGDADYGFKLYDFDLSLGPTPTDKLIRVHRGSIFTKDRFNTVQVQRVAVSAGKSHGVFDGWVDTVKGLINITISDNEFPDLGAWLERFGLPQFANSAGGGTITITGPLKTPTVATQMNLGGVPCLQNLAVSASINTQTSIATISHVSSAGLGGSLDGSGQVTLGAVPVIDSFHLTGKQLDGAKLCGLAGIVKGTLDDIDVDIEHTPLQPRSTAEWLGYVSAHVAAKHVAVYGDGYSDVGLCVNHGDDGRLCRSSGPSAGANPGRLEPDDLGACEQAKHSNHQGFCLVTTASRDQGGNLDATIASLPTARTGRAVVPARLAGTIALDNVPLAVLDQLVGKGTLGGLFNATLHLQGTARAPQAFGSVDVLRTWIAGAFFGDSQLQVDPIKVGKMPSLFIHGQAFAGQLEIAATVGSAPPYPVDLAVTGRRVDIDQFVDLASQLHIHEAIQTWASGTVTVHTELAPLDGKPPQPEAWVEITELEAILDHRSKDGRLTPLRFKLVPKADQYAMSLRVTSSTVELSCRNPAVPSGREPCLATLDTPAGLITLEGSATVSQMHLVANSVDAQGNRGPLDLRRLGPLLENQLDAIEGHLDLHAEVTGTLAKPSYAISVDVKDAVRLRPSGGDTTIQILGAHRDGEVEVPGAKLTLENGRLRLDNVTVATEDAQAAITVAGSIGLAGLQPTSWDLAIRGKLAGKLLLVIAPNVVAQASGLARIVGALVVKGDGQLPAVDGKLTFDTPAGEHPTPLMVTPRGLRRELALLGGSIDVSTQTNGAHRTYTLDVSDNNLLTASIDNEGKLRNIDGNLVLSDGEADHAEIKLDAENIPLRIPYTLELTMSGKDIALVLPNKGSVWRAEGNVSIVSGKYERNFELAEAGARLLAPATAAPAKPFWDEYPAIGNAELNIVLDVRRFAVENNIAQIELEGPRILITGSPKDPRLSGSIRVQRGEFKIPLTRAKFLRTTGSIDFSDNEPATNPRLDITSDAPDYLDLSGQQHIITLSITGTLEQPLWDLKTNTGLDKSQTLALLLLGRNPEQLRRSLGDQALGTNPTVVDPSTNPSSNFGDQVIKDLAGQYVSDLLGGSLTKLTQLDVLRFEIGFGSVGVHAEKKAFTNLRLFGDAETTVRGQTLNARVEIKTPWHLPWKIITNDRITLQGVYLDKTFSDPADQAQNIQDLQGKVVYRLFIP